MRSTDTPVHRGLDLFTISLRPTTSKDLLPTDGSHHEAPCVLDSIPPEASSSVMMNACRSLVSLVLLALAAGAQAFDPLGPPPDWTLPRIMTYLTGMKVPAVSFEGATLEEVLEVLKMGRPECYTPRLTADDALLHSKIELTLAHKDATVGELLGQVAERFKADLRITPGAIKLVARTSAPGQGS